MAYGTQNIYGHGFVVAGVPNYLDDEARTAPHAVFKTKSAAARKAISEGIWHLEHVPEVEGISYAQIEGFPGLWFVIWQYTAETAAKTVEWETAQAATKAGA